MSGIKQLKSKKQSLESINKVTKSMQLISTVKSQKALKDLRDYQTFYKKIENIFKSISSDINFEEKDYTGNLWVIFSSDLGLAGGYNTNIIKLIESNISKDDELIVVGKKLSSVVKHNFNNEAIFIESNLLLKDEISSVVQKIKYSFLTNKKNIKVIYTKFISQLEFVPEIKQILPITKEDLVDQQSLGDKIIEFEPNKEELFKNIINLYVESLIRGFWKEANASEQTSRRVAMENATKNGQDLLDQLSIEFNRSRQAKITQEISEIIGGAEALK